MQKLCQIVIKVSGALFVGVLGWVSWPAPAILACMAGIVLVLVAYFKPETIIKRR